MDLFPFCNIIYVFIFGLYSDIGSVAMSLCVYIYIYVCVYVCTYIHSGTDILFVCVCAHIEDESKGWEWKDSSNIR